MRPPTAGAEVRHGVRVTGLLRGAGGRVTGVVTTGRGRPGAGGARRAGDRGRRARSWIAAATGRRPRRALPAARRRDRLRLLGRPAADGYRWLYRPGVSAGAIPTNDGMTCVFAGGRPEEPSRPCCAERGPEGTLRDAGRSGAARAPALRAAQRSAPCGTCAGIPGHLRAAAGPGWALVGDAGYWKDPLSTHGMTAALRDAELLSRAVVDAPHPGPAQTAALGRLRSAPRRAVAADARRRRAGGRPRLGPAGYPRPAPGAGLDHDRRDRPAGGPARGGRGGQCSPAGDVERCRRFRARAEAVELR